jgi:hypothetical protein
MEDLMGLLEIHEDLIHEKIEAMPHGAEGGLVAIFGEEWALIGTSGQKKRFGQLFKAAVRSNRYPAIEWVRIENSERFDVYRKR